MTSITIMRETIAFVASLNCGWKFVAQKTGARIGCVNIGPFLMLIRIGSPVMIDFTIDDKCH
ncbi:MULTISPECIES: hypothetical protein [Bradyrhizobium]|uniref:hypothetical protein n=1 Tax=Bradyrhizobium TaxID=374 RepID=UPI0012BD584C|nr:MULTISPECIES: hypothetical protein [Bradyrhizobium]MBR0884641.1 hypothetical protein [Bradyrhizobium liaoningense]MBR0998318.1 hypothetical protein [Bradyrhizobium liaoningense]MBR1071292.1 hypothetical protein [Bradyrhizobium liaoningense]MCP1739697.1 hypothetical protein [Bradyrhizobium japonicum]MCP1857373.1 hypothetical protein [Bradyrhizobium japonicum]